MFLRGSMFVWLVAVGLWGEGHSDGLQQATCTVTALSGCRVSGEAYTVQYMEPCGGRVVVQLL